MALAQRRSDEERIKDRSRRIARRRTPRIGAVVGWDGGVAAPLNWIEREYLIERAAVRTAHAPRRCSCWLCKRERYDRRSEREMERRLIEEGGEIA